MFRGGVDRPTLPWSGIYLDNFLVFRRVSSGKRKGRPGTGNRDSTSTVFSRVSLFHYSTFRVCFPYFIFFFFVCFAWRNGVLFVARGIIKKKEKTNRYSTPLEVERSEYKND